MSGRLSLGEPERRSLAAGAAAFGFSLDARKLDLFCRFADLLGLWSARMSLISCRTARELVERHFVDSLAVGPWIRDAATVVDLGSGAGFPGVPLAMVHPEKRLILVEPRRRRANFLRETRRVLGLSNAEIVEARAEEGSRSVDLPLADAVVCRAVWARAGALLVTPAWLRPSGTLICMKGGGARARAESAQTERPAREGSEKFERKKLSQVEEMLLECSVTYRIGAGRRRALDVYRRCPEN